MGPGSAEFIHTVIECAKLAFADREAWYGDPRPTDVPLAELLSPEYAAQRRAWSARRRPRSWSPARPAAPSRGCPGTRRPAARRAPVAAGPTAEESGAGTAPRWRRPARACGSGRLAAADPAGDPGCGPGDTCHLDVADSFGNLVSATPSGGWLQSSPVIPGLGFCLGTRAQMFTLTPGLASTPGARAGGRGPRCRPAWRCATASRTWRSARPAATSRTSGRSAFFLNHVLFGMNLQQAIDAPAFHTDHFPSSFYPRESSAALAGRRGQARRAGARPTCAAAGTR